MKERKVRDKREREAQLLNRVASKTNVIKCEFPAVGAKKGKAARNAEFNVGLHGRFFCKTGPE